MTICGNAILRMSGGFFSPEMAGNGPGLNPVESNQIKVNQGKIKSRQQCVFCCNNHEVNGLSV